jgi:pyruvate/2-oxoglutarate dehydrogenase complex dihydrolipoamide acyltransferase (E2) component
MDFVLPEFPDVAEMSGGGGTPEAEVVEWIAADGSAVQPGEDVLEIALDKANVIVPAPAAGVLRHGVRDGDVVSPGDVLGTIDS